MGKVRGKGKRVALGGCGSRSYTIRNVEYVGRKGPTYKMKRVVPTCL